MRGNHKTAIFDKEHRYFGGIIYPSDFNTDYREENSKKSSSIAARIEKDLKRRQ